jgi:hypothetical protein
VTIVLGVALALAIGAAPVPQAPPAGPETFDANAHVAGAAGALAARIRVQIDRYIADVDRKAITQALKTGGYASFLNTLRQAPTLGHVLVGDQKFAVRWATQETVKFNRTILVVTDQPVFFVGGGAAKAKPREGYNVAVIRLEVDNVGIGSGTMAAAARVRPGGESGVQLDDYAESPIKLVTVTKVAAPGSTK